jgi:hypothetical protein
MFWDNGSIGVEETTDPGFVQIRCDGAAARPVDTDGHGS